MRAELREGVCSKAEAGQPEECFLLPVELDFFGLGQGEVEEGSNTHACFFPFVNFPSQAESAAQRNPLFPALLPALSLPAGPSQLQPQPFSYCWGKQKTTAMQQQTGLHHVYAMTEAWAQIQRGWGSSSNSDSPSTSKAALGRQRGLKGPWRSLPPSLSFHREAHKQGVNWPRSCRVLRSGLGNTEERERRLKFLVEEEEEEANSSSQVTALSSCSFSPHAYSAASFHLRSLSLVKEMKAEETRSLR